MLELEAHKRKRYIEIDDYKSWKGGDQILINSGTGSGKTTFVFNKLVAEAAAHGKYVVYICNRKTLREQQTKKYMVENDAWRKVLILTYQYCEYSRQFPSFKFDPYNESPSKIEKDAIECNHITEPIQINESDVMYYIFDESHYFVCDAMFNERAHFWYNVKFKFEHSITVFLTATSEPLLLFLKCRNLSPYEFFKQLNEELSEKTNRDTPKVIKVSLSKEKNVAPYINVMSMNTEVTELPNSSNVNTIRTITDFVSDAIDISNHNIKMYSLKPDYSNYNSMYFEEYEDLFDDIVESKDKWLIFVDNKETGTRLEVLLNYLFRYNASSRIRQKRATFIFSGMNKTLDALACRELQNLTDNETFSSDVLIATSVIDNGVNIDPIKCPGLSHIVINQIEKTTFLQMLGRRRLLDSETVNVYIKITDPRKINTLKHEYEKTFRYLTNFRLADEVYYKSVGAPTANWDGMKAVSFVSNKGREQVVKDFWKYAIYIKPSGKNVSASAKPNSKLLDEFELNMATLFSAFYRYYQVCQSMENKFDSLHFLRKQLDWIDATFDITHWHCLSRNINEMNDMMYKYLSKDWFGDEEQMEFRTKCMNLIYVLPKDALPPFVQRNKSKYRNGTLNLPQRTTINNIFKFYNMPYEIVAKTSFKNKQKRKLWKVKRLTTTFFFDNPKVIEQGI